MPAHEGGGWKTHSAEWGWHEHMHADGSGGIHTHSHEHAGDADHTPRRDDGVSHVHDPASPPLEASRAVSAGIAERLRVGPPVTGLLGRQPAHRDTRAAADASDDELYRDLLGDQ